VINERGLTTTVWWAGNLPSQDLDVVLRIGQASDFKAFRDALRDWYAPTHNFVYADDKGNIGLISAGYYPQVAKGQPWLPMPGTGEYDVTGTVPYADIPQIYDPPSNVVWSANQRQVASDYPYYIGTASNFFDPGYRANEIHRVLSQDRQLGATDMMALQTDTRDFLASEITPLLVQALATDQLSGGEQQVREMLTNWDYTMAVDSAAASVWWTFWQDYLAQTFDPWWRAQGVKIDKQEVIDMLGQDLEAWTLGDPSNAAFTPPGGPTQTATDVMRKAFHAAYASLKADLGPDPGSWTWGTLHTRVLDNLAQISALSYGPRAERGDANTPLAAGGSPSNHGPSWRMVVDWGTHTFSGIYPGGQSENPASSWYLDRVDTWWSGQYATMLTANQAAKSPGAATWKLQS
jgi:penicillin amidase